MKKIFLITCITTEPLYSVYHELRRIYITFNPQIHKMSVNIY